ncbi:MAG TPA: TPM domain-containing protein [Chthoniobacterales bacterium]
MRCPSCLTPAAEPVSECPACGMSLAKLDAKYKTVPRHLRFITDHVSLFSGEEHQALAHQIKALEKLYLGLHVTLMTLELPPNTNLREYMFWLFNRCRFSPIDAKLNRNYSVVIVIDVTSGTAFMSTGFGFEQWLQDEDLQAILDPAIPHFKKNQMAAGCKTIFDRLAARIRSICLENDRKKGGAPKRLAVTDDL